VIDILGIDMCKIIEVSIGYNLTVFLFLITILKESLILID